MVHDFSIDENDDSFIFIPFEIDDSGLDAYEHRIYCYLANRGKKYPKTVNTIASHTGIGVTKVKLALKVLIKKGFVTKYCFTLELAKKIIQSKTPQNYHQGFLKCEWCSSKTIFLESHHYPIKQSEGGNKTVNICPSCHSEFHYLTETYFYCLAPSATSPEAVS